MNIGARMIAYEQETRAAIRRCGCCCECVIMVAMDRPDPSREVALFAAVTHEPWCPLPRSHEGNGMPVSLGGASA